MKSSPKKVVERKKPKHHRNDGKRSKSELRDIKNLKANIDGIDEMETYHHHAKPATRPAQLGRPSTRSSVKSHAPLTMH